MPKTIKLYKIRKKLLSMHIFSAFTGVGQCLTNFGSSYPSLSASSDLAASLGGGGIGVPSSGNLTPVSAPSPSLTSHTSLPAPSLTTFGFTQVLLDFQAKRNDILTNNSKGKFPHNPYPFFLPLFTHPSSFS